MTKEDALRELLQRKADLLAQPYPHDKAELRKVNRALLRLNARYTLDSAVLRYGIKGQGARPST